MVNPADRQQTANDTLQVLLIEDDPRDALVFSNLVESYAPDDFQIVHVQNLEAGLTQLKSTLFDAIVLDINLPRHSGTRSVELITQTGAIAPIICISGSTDENTAFDMIKAGAQDFISKMEMSPEQTVRTIKYSIFRKATERNLNILAQYDSLTGLPNRRLFDDRLEHAFANATRNKSGLALMFIDLDEFKSINDSYGHAAGDALLKIASERLINCVRDSDTVARIGGDEFVVLLEGAVDEEGAEVVADKILRTVGEPIDLFGNKVLATTSIGIAIYPVSAKTKNLLVSRADEAMYRAKSAGKNSCVVYSKSDEASNVSHLKTKR